MCFAGPVSTRPGPVERVDHLAIRAEDAVQAVLGHGLRRAGWVPRVVAHVGYGLEGAWVRVLARVVLVPEGSLVARHPEDARGWRRFATQSAAGVPVTIDVGGLRTRVESDREGYVDVRLPVTDLPAGWATAELRPDDHDDSYDDDSADGDDGDEGRQDAPVTTAQLRIVAADARHGLVSDIDDTVMITMLPRPLVAFRNAFVSREVDRLPVPGMAGLYRDLVAERPDTFVVYLSTGAWNVAGAIGRFLARHDYPPGPALLTDWGPTPSGWFRSGQRHKTTELRRLMSDFPQLRWTLVGDDGQHDPTIYAETAAEHPGRVEAILIRRLSLGEQVARYGHLDAQREPAEARTGPRSDPRASPGTGYGDDGDQLRGEARRLGLLRRRR